MKFGVKISIIIGIVCMLALSFTMVSAVSAANNTTGENGTDEELKPIVIPPEKQPNPKPDPTPTPKPSPSPKKDVKITNGVAMKSTGVPIGIIFVSLLFSLGFLVRRDF